VLGALLSLCLLAQVYSHCCDIIQHLATLPLGAEVLVQIDRLVQLLETPAFAFLRLQLLQPSRHPDLLRALYGLLMLLPQSSAFTTLSARLQAVPAVTLMQLESLQLQQQGSGSKGGGKQQQQQLEQQQWADFDELLKNFVARQQQHAAEEERRRLLVEGLRIEEDIQKEQQHQASMAALERSSPTSSAVAAGGGDE
jgi:vacuole morphology and inheritance protein 14